MLLPATQIYYFCPKCDWDICNTCFHKPIDGDDVELSASDEEMNIDEHWIPYRYIPGLKMIRYADCIPAEIEETDEEVEDLLENV